MFGFKKTPTIDEIAKNSSTDSYFLKEVTGKDENQDIAISLRGINLPKNLKEEHDLTIKLGLTRQSTIILLESLNFKLIHRDDCYKLLGFWDSKEKKKVSLTSFPINEYFGKIPFEILKKFEEVKKQNIFDRIWIIAKKGKAKAILVGEKFSSCDERVVPENRHLEKIYHEDEDYPKKIGYRKSNFWERDTVVMLIEQWENENALD